MSEVHGVIGQPYDDFLGPSLNLASWSIREALAPDGTMWRYMDPGVSVSVGAGELEIAAERFRRGHDSVQAFDNAKVLILSTIDYLVPASGTLSISVEIWAAKHGGDANDLRDGFAALNVVDFETGLVLDIVTSGGRHGAIYERLARPQWASFLHLVDSPLHCPHAIPGTWQRFEIEIDSANGSARWLLDGVCIFAVAELIVIPRSVRFGPGLLTLRRITTLGSTSAHGQGITARWRNFRVATRC